jgi:predicted enzyme related to lactoylglutathione lyase
LRRLSIAAGFVRPGGVTGTRPSQTQEIQMTNAPGRFVWFEYVSSDASKAQHLFGELFGWSAKRVPMPDGEYVMIAAADGQTIGGYGAAPAGAPAGASWLPYLRVPNAADATARTETLGGAVVKPPFKVGDFATMAIVRDPHGASFALWQPVKVEEPPAPAAGHFVWNELASKDPTASVTFYRELAGFTAQAMDMGEMGTYHVLESDGQSRAGIMAQQMPDAPHAWLPYVQVASADETAERAARLGTTIIVPPTQIPNVGRFAIFVDTLGGVTGILQP